MKVNAPNLHLFAFQLRQAVNLTPEAFAPEQDFLWNNGDAIVKAITGKDLQISQQIDAKKLTDSFRVDLLLNEKIIDDNPTIQVQHKLALDNRANLPIEGFAHPLSFPDSLVLSLTVGGAEKKEDGTPTEDVDIEVFRRLNPNNCFTLPSNPTFIGQTLLISAKISNTEAQTNFREIADECLKKVFPNNYQLPPYKRQGKLFDSPIFEYGLFDQLENYQHVIVWLFSDEEAIKKFNDCYSQLIDLFFFRTKVVKTFQDSRIIYQELRKACREIEEEVDNLPQPEYSGTETNLTDLKAKLKKLPHLNLKYTRLIRNLEEYQNTIAINADNYALRIQQICDETKTQEVKFLAEFSQKSCPFFQQQITADLSYFRHASGLLNRAIDSIRGIVEIEQAERDRQKEATDKIRDAKLQNTIQAVGVGLGVGTGVAGIFAQTFPLIIEKEWALPSEEQPLLSPHPFLISFPMSLLLGAFLGWQAWRFCRKRLDSKLPTETLSANNPTSLPASPNPEFRPFPNRQTEQKAEGSASVDN